MRKIARTGGSDLIARRHVSDLGRGSLRTLFRDGAAVVVLDMEGQAATLWQRLVDKTAETLPWLLPLADIAANHYGFADISTALGDVVYFQPGLHGYIGRKIELNLDQNGKLQWRPEKFIQNGRTAMPNAAAMEECWSLVDRIMAALAPESLPPARHRAVVQRLKYQPSAQDFASLANLTHDALARWGRLGYRVDVNRGALHHWLSGRWISDAMGVLMAVPGGRAIAKGINHILASAAAPEPAESRIVIERPHIDYRYFSALCGCRSNVRTEFLAHGTWHELPVELNSLAIIPGSMAKPAFQIEPVLHRVTYPQDMEGATPDLRTGNVTLLLGAV